MLNPAKKEHVHKVKISALKRKITNLESETQHLKTLKSSPKTNTQIKQKQSLIKLYKYILTKTQQTPTAKYQPS